MGLDPNGFRPLAAVDGSRHMPDSHMAHMDVSMLVGVPPPPPKTPPPKKNRRPSRPNTPLGEDPGVLMPSSVSRVLAMNAAPRSQEIKNGMVPRDTKKTMNIAEERRRAALAMYNSEDLVLDREESFTTRELLRPVTPSENKPLPQSRHRESPAASTRSRGVPSASPTSQVTEPHSNQTPLHDAFTEKSQFSSAKSASTPQPSPLAEKQKQKQTIAFNKIEREDKASKKEEKKKGGLFKRFFRGGKGKEKDNASEKAVSASNHKIPASGTRNFPRVATSKVPQGVPSMSTAKVSAPRQMMEPTPKARSHQRTLTSSLKDNADFVYSVETSSRDAAAEIESPWGFDTTGSPTSSTSSGPKVSENVATVKAPMPPSPTTSDAAFKSVVSLTMQATSPSPSDISFLSGLQTPRILDPPDEAVYDDPPFSFEPRHQSHSNTNPVELTVSASQNDEEEPSRIESTRSRISDVYEDNIQRDGVGGLISDLPSNLSDERPEIFFSHDEVSILTGPSFESLHKKTVKSFDPAPAADGLYHDPFGHYFDPSKNHDANAMDPSETDSFVDEPYIDGLPGHGSLRVDVRQRHKTQDPVGESPFHDGPRGSKSAGARHPDPVGDSPMEFVARKASSSATFKDPVGESPIHATPAGLVRDAFHEPAGSLLSLVTSKVNPSATPAQRGVQSQGPSSTDEDFSENVADPTLQQLTPGYISDDSETVHAEEKKEDDGDVVERAPHIPSKVVSAKKASRRKETDADRISSQKGQQKSTEQDIKGMSSATRAALKLAKLTENHDENGQVAKPGLNPVLDGRVGSNKQVVPRLVVNTKDTLKTKRNKFSTANAPTEGKDNPTEQKVSKSKAGEESNEAGFRSGSVTPAATAKPLTVSAAAFTNAKAVAYLHRIQGEPSPRHSWLSSKKKQKEEIIVEAKPASAKKKDKSSGVSTPKLKPPSPEDYGAHDPELLDLMSRSSLPKEKPNVPPTPEALFAASSSPALGRSAAESSTNNSTRMFSAYSSKFNGRKPARKEIPPLAASPRIEALDKRGIEMLSSTRLPQKPIQADSPRTVFKKRVQVVTASSAISSVAVARGIKLRKNKRIDDIQSGRSTPVILTPKKRPTGGNRFNFVPADESEIKDPIQRAGRRLLSKAAIPIQCAARRFLAKGEAVDRMWALIEMQSYFRRWRCEANLQASVDAATLLQASFRGWLTRDKVKDMQYCAVQIQRVVRGHLAALRAYDTIYCVVQIQAAVRGFFDRKIIAIKQETATLIQATYRGHATRNFQVKSRAAVAIQAAYRGCKARQGFGAILAGVAIQKAYRGFKARQLFASSVASISLIQTAWRSYSGRIKFQFKIVDIIISQSVVRRWAACRVVRILKDSKLSCFAVKIQKVWRGYSARESLMRNLAACRIQATWRGFHCYTDYIFALVDILVVQRTVRQWLAIKVTKEIRRNKAATKIQTQWRRRKAQVTMLFSLVHIIIAQVSGILVRSAFKSFPSFDHTNTRQFLSLYL
jgi:hypothetical protein